MHRRLDRIGLVGLGLAAVLAVGTVVAAPAPAPRPLLAPAEPRPEPVLPEASRFDRRVLRERGVRVDRCLLGGCEGETAAGTIAVDLFDRDRVVLEPVRIVPDEAGRTVWIGRDAASTVRATFVAGRRAVAGHVRVSGRTYALRTDAAGAAVLREIDPAPAPGCVVDPVGGTPLEASVAPPTGAERRRGYRERDLDRPTGAPGRRPGRRTPPPPGPGAVPPGMDVPGPVLGEDGSRVDVAVVYTAATRAAEGGTDAIETLIVLAVEEANAAFADSGVDLRLHVVRTFESAYRESGDVEVDLERLRDPTDGELDDVHAVRDAYGADLVALWIAGPAACDRGLCCGAAYIAVRDGAGLPERAFGVTSRTCIDDWSFAHEIGHNLGLDHAHEDATGVGAYAYSHGYKSEGRFRTVLAYPCATPCPRIGRFSNPERTWGGEPTGVPEGQPFAADNATSLDRARAVFGNFRPSPTPPPAPLALAPSGTTASRRPPYVWTRVETAGWYRLQVETANGLPVHDDWVAAFEVCGSHTCSTVPDAPLADDDAHVWRVVAWNATGDGVPSEDRTFVPDVPGPPPPAVLVEPTGTVGPDAAFRFSPAPGAAWYRLERWTAGAPAGAWWVPARGRCDASGCVAAPPEPIPPGDHAWRVRSWNAEAGGGAFSDLVPFRVEGPALSPASRPTRRDAARSGAR